MSSPNAEGTQAGSERILLVDDDEAFSKALSGALRRRGHEVAVAHRYEEALATAQSFAPTRAIVDLRMPGRGGLELVAALSSAHPGLRIVVLTGYGSIATAVEAIKLGAVHYLTKPADVSEILAAFDHQAPFSPGDERYDVTTIALEVLAGMK